MQYSFAAKINYEDFSSGRVILNKIGFTNYPVRLACEIFSRCLSAVGKSENLAVYDPCCGCGYLLTVLGFLFNEKIGSLCGSDISEDAVDLTMKNLNLLTTSGLRNRKMQLKALHDSHGKNSHLLAIQSADRLESFLKNKIRLNAFTRDILDPKQSVCRDFLADIIITDVPYGNLTSWSNSDGFAIDKMLKNLLPNLNPRSVVAVSGDKSQKIGSPRYRRIGKFLVGKRKIELLKINESHGK